MDKNKIMGSLFGGAIGDALGYPIEFFKGIKEKQVTRYQDDKGIISDDTQITLFTANGILWRETRLKAKGTAPSIDDALYFAYLDWLETQDKFKPNQTKVTWLKLVPELNVQRAPGQTCMAALASGKKGTLEKSINDSKGCGGVMRVAPVGLCASSVELAGEYGAKAAAITHGHIMSTMASFVFAAMIYQLANTSCGIEEAINKALGLLEDFCKQNKLKAKKELNTFVAAINAAIEKSKQVAKDSEAIKTLGEGWVAEEALAIAIYSCLKYKDSFEDAIVCAVNHDGDSDSTGAIAGNIMGAYLGYDKIPNYFVDSLESKDIIQEVAEDLFTLSAGENIDNTAWDNKYIYCKK